MEDQVEVVELKGVVQVVQEIHLQFLPHKVIMEDQEYQEDIHLVEAVVVLVQQVEMEFHQHVEEMVELVVLFPHLFLVGQQQVLVKQVQQEDIFQAVVVEV